MPTITIYSSGATLEGATPARTLNFTVELSEAATVATTYYWSTQEGTALQGVDFNNVTFSSLVFAPGERIKTISVTLVNDAIVEADELLYVNVFNTNNASTAQLLASAKGFITDVLTSDITASLADAANVNVESLTLTGTADINGTGNNNSNKITGNSGKNVLNGANGNDSLAGGAGDDTLIGGAGNDTLDGGSGVDSMAGGAGDDLYIIGNALDVVSLDPATGENVNSGNDTIQSSINFALKSGSFIENLTLAGSAKNGTGNEYNNLITGNSQANLLNGAGTDPVLVSGNDTLIGLGGADTLLGGDGNDVLDGGTGLNSLVGGVGNDVYVITNTSDKVVESSGVDGGIDRIETASSYSIAALDLIENITLTGDNAVNAIGNGGDNLLIGNDSENLIEGKGGNDRLEGRGGRDTLIGGKGDDTYTLLQNPWTPLDELVELSKGGSDLVQINADYTLGKNFERLQLLGNGDFSGYGNSKANSIEGNEGNNILDGKGGADDLRGGLGSDTYILNDAVDRATETESTAIGGIDTVIVDFEDTEVFVLAANIENVTLASTEFGAKVFAADGNTTNNRMLGNEAANMFRGFAGLDTLIGGGGQDTLHGGDNNDTYQINIEDNDIIQETELTNLPPFFTPGNPDNTNITLDTIIASHTGPTAAEYTMPVNVERFFFEQVTDILLNGNTSLNFVQTGGGDDSIFVGFANDTVNSGAGRDSVEGGEGNDSLSGGEGDDTLIGGEGNDTLNGGAGTDLLDGGSGNDLYVIDTELDLLVSPEVLDGGVDKVESSISHRLLDNFENLTLTGTENTNGMGNGLNNIIIGNTGNNTLDGQGGDDNLDGSLGNDTLFGRDGDDTLLGGSGIDVLFGHAGNDSLSGGTEADTMRGGLGNDIYEVQGTTNLVIENLDQGIDLVNSRISQYTLTDNVEQLVLVDQTIAISGTGNALDNTITGNRSANIIDGAAGSDTMIGGDGNDKYYVDNVGDVVIENSIPINVGLTSGEDIVFASVSGYTLGGNVENLTLIGSAISGTGNSLANRIFGNELNNVLNGGAGNDYLDGGLGKDTMSGGAGDDVYFAEISTDKVVELSGDGVDRLVSLVSQTLPDHVDNLSLLGVESLQGIGNTLSNVIAGNDGNNLLSGKSGNDQLFGNAGSDTLSGGSGNDTLTGGSGADFFEFMSGTAYSASDFGSDKLLDFGRADADKIRLGKTTFGLTGTIGGFLSNAQFESVTKESLVGTSSAKIVHSQVTGNIYFNSNGAADLGDFLIAETSFKGVGSELFPNDFVLA